ETALEKPNSIVVTEAFALKHFGDENPVGKIISINEQNWTKPDEFTVTGVIAEPKTPSTVNFEILRSLQLRPFKDGFYSFLEMYATVLPTTTVETLNKNIQNVYAPFKSALLERQGLK